MGHIMKRTILRAREMITSRFPELAPDFLIYGEGWDFGEVFRGARGPNGSAIKLAGTGIGCFNDRYTIVFGSKICLHVTHLFLTKLLYEPKIIYVYMDILQHPRRSNWRELA